MTEQKGKWGLPCPMGEECNHNRPHKCTTAYQNEQAREFSSSGSCQLLSGQFIARRDTSGRATADLKFVNDASGKPTPSAGAVVVKPQPTEEVKAIAKQLLEAGVKSSDL